MTLEQEISAALTSEATTADELTALVVRAQAAIVDADEKAKRQEERVYDPELCPDPKEPRAAMENALLASGRLRTLLWRLQSKHAQVKAGERLTAWEAEFADCKAERDALALEFDETYPAMVAKLIDLFARMATHDAKVSDLHQARPSGVTLGLDSPELLARDLTEYSRGTPSLLRCVQLYDRFGKQVWPPPVARDMSNLCTLALQPASFAGLVHGP
jgi:hypothetical protein